MSKWLGLIGVLTVLWVVGAAAYYLDWLPMGQVIAALASIMVATIGLFAFFGGKTKGQH